MKIPIMYRQKQIQCLALPPEYLIPDDRESSVQRHSPPSKNRKNHGSDNTSAGSSQKK